MPSTCVRLTPRVCHAPRVCHTLRICLASLSHRAAAVQDAMRDARQDGFDWLLHIDIDELWYSPMAAVQAEGAPAFFAALHPSVAEVSFRNFEAVPPAPPASGPEPDDAGECWFERTRLFKPHTAFTRSPEANRARDIKSNGQHLRSRLAQGKERAAGLHAPEGDDSDGEEGKLQDLDLDLSDPCDAALHYLTMARLGGLGFTALPASASRLGMGRDAAIEAADRHRARKKAQPQRRQRRQQMRASGDAAAAADANAESEASDQEARQEVLESARFEALGMKYFHAHEQGKAAVRLWPGLRCALPRAGIHGNIGLAGDRLVCEGPGSPIILHYVACSYQGWLRKYEVRAPSLDGEARRVLPRRTDPGGGIGGWGAGGRVQWRWQGCGGFRCRQ